MARVATPRSLPNRQLRNSNLIDGINLRRSLPNRQLRNRRNDALHRRDEFTAE